MTIDSIRELLAKDPFHPFRIRASSGMAYDVRNPGLVVVLKSQVFVAEPNSDRFSIIPFLHVAGVELIGNGRGQRSRRRQ
jgi:hypothetical protein